MSRFVAALAFVFLALVTPTAAAEPVPGREAKELVIYHIEGRRSERVIWLCEELGIPYRLSFIRGDVMGSLDNIRKVSPVMTMAPTVVYDGEVLVESGAILQILVDRHGAGRLQPPVTSQDYLFHQQWMHMSEGSVMPRLTAGAGKKLDPDAYKPGMGPPVGADAVLYFMEHFLAEHPYFGGSEFSAADIMMHVSVRAVPYIFGGDLSRYPNIAAWNAKVEARPAYKRMMAAALPDGVVPPTVRAAPPKTP